VERFIERYKDRIVGTIAGFDRILFRGQILSICHIGGMERFLSSQRILNKEFRRFAEMFTERIKRHAEQVAEQNGRPYRYLPSPSISKERYVRELMANNPVDEGLICVLSCVEPCHSFGLRSDRESKHLLLSWELRKCQHYYFYYMDRDFGLMHVRLQSWFPFTIQVCVNGREWLARQMDRAGIKYTQVENCFTKIGDLKRAQAISDSLSEMKLAPVLSAFAERVNPWLSKKASVVLHPYYWTIRQGEYATDVLFRDRESLADVYPALAHHAIEQFSCDDVMRFLGHRTNIRFSGECKSSFERRIEGVRVKHWVGENSIKMYDKAGSVLRVETTINNPKRFRVRRHIETAAGTVVKCLPMRKGIADLRRRVEVSRAANGRYLEALAVVGERKPSRKILDDVSRRIELNGLSYRALRPITTPETELFRAILRGENQLQGLRNEDLRRYLYPDREHDERARKKASARTSRQLRLLRAHGLIAKVPKTYYYRATKKGHEVMSTALIFRETDFVLLAA
jgi:hypothetical protein